ncbi:MAG: phenylacetate--CoA ligase, partial [Micrococcales bacterium]|nr:phenylacetate--CoA ligase [Micrococcales bacterium]
RFAEIAPQYQIVLTSKGSLDHAELQVETVPDFPFDEVRRLEALTKKIAWELRSSLQVAVDVRIVEPKTVERFDGKARRIIDLREGTKP